MIPLTARSRTQYWRMNKENNNNECVCKLGERVGEATTRDSPLGTMGRGFPWGGLLLGMGTGTPPSESSMIVHIPIGAETGVKTGGCYSSLPTSLQEGGAGGGVH